MKILVIQQKKIGDVLMSSIICNNLKKAYPDAQIDYMIYASTVPVVQGNPNIDNIILFIEKYRESKWALFKFLLSIRKKKYDLIIDHYSKLESWLTVLLSKATRRVSHKKPGRVFLYTDRVDMPQTPSSNLGLAIETRLSLLDPLKLDIKLDPLPKLYLTDQEKAFAKKLFTDHNVDPSRKTAMVSIIGSSDDKTYPLKYMSTIVDFIADTVDVNIIFNYIPSQVNKAREVYEGCKEKSQSQIYFDLLGENLRDYIALMDQCDFIIGNDGGSIHIAKALKKPSFTIFSSWIKKQDWATFDDGKFHKSVHLEDYQPELFQEKKSVKEQREKNLDFYIRFKPKYFLSDLGEFLKDRVYGGKEKNTYISKQIQCYF